MARNCKDQLKLFFIYLKIQLLFSYNSTNTKLPKTHRFSFLSFILLCSSVLLYILSYIEAVKKLFRVLQSEVFDEKKLKIDVLVHSVKVILTIISIWMLHFSFKSRQIIETIVRHLSIADDLLGQEIDRTKTINFTVAGLMCIKLMLFLACSPFLTRGFPLEGLVFIFNEIFVNCIEDSVEHIFIVLCAEIVARLQCFQV